MYPPDTLASQALAALFTAPAEHLAAPDRAIAETDLARFEGDGGNLYLDVTSGTQQPLPAGLELDVQLRRYTIDAGLDYELTPRSVLGDEGYSQRATVPEGTLLLARATAPGYHSFSRCFRVLPGTIKCLSLKLYDTNEAPDLLLAYPYGDLVLADDLDHLVTPEPPVVVPYLEEKSISIWRRGDKVAAGPKHRAEFTKPKTDPKKRKAARRAASKARRR